MQIGDSGALCEIDMEKAYDRVNWELIDYILRRLLFEFKWCKRMKKWKNAMKLFFYHYQWFPSRIFQEIEGIEARWSAPPFLVFDVVETLEGLLSRLLNGLIEGFKMGNEGPMVIPQFANDTSVMY